MSKYLTLLILVLLSFIKSNSQINTKIYGTTNVVQNGKVVILKIAPHELYVSRLKSDTVELKNSKFEFEALLNVPEQFRLQLFDSKSGSKYFSELFFVDPGIQQIHVDSSYSKYDLRFSGKVVLSNAKTNHEFKEKYFRQFDSINVIIRTILNNLENCYEIKNEKEKQSCLSDIELRRMSYRRSRDSLLYAYTLQNPHSKIVKWQLFELLEFYGYNNFYARILDRISPDLSTQDQNYLYDLLQRSALTAVGAIFPLERFMIRNTTNIKYALIEFWFSGCGPCLQQFETLKKIYPFYKNKGFEIIAISTDPQNSISEYNKILNKKKYGWHQILDTGGVKSSMIDIQKYPTNFLIDNAGKILFKDITPFVLEKFLKENL